MPSFQRAWMGKVTNNMIPMEIIFPIDSVLLYLILYRTLDAAHPAAKNMIPFLSLRKNLSINLKFNYLFQLPKPKTFKPQKGKGKNIPYLENLEYYFEAFFGKKNSVAAYRMSDGDIESVRAMN